MTNRRPRLKNHEARKTRRLGRAFPGEALGVGAALEAVGAVDPGGRAVGEGGPVVGLAPDQQAVGGALEAVAVVRVMTLVLGAVADDVRDQVVQRLEAEREGALARAG